MSTMTAQPRRRRSRGARGERALEWFDELLFDNVEVCSRCFSRIRDHEEHDQDLNRLGTNQNRPSETLERTGDGTMGYAVETHDRHGAIRTHPPRTYCGECGSQGGMNDPLQIRCEQTMLRHGDAIVRRLHEAGCYPDLEYFYGALQRLKSEPENQGRDRQIFAAAAYAAVQRGTTR